MEETQRNIGWYGKLVFACYAASFALYMLLGVVTLPIFGMAVLDSMFSSYAPFVFVVLMLLVSPIIYRRLK